MVVTTPYTTSVYANLSECVRCLLPLNDLVITNIQVQVANVQCCRVDRVRNYLWFHTWPLKFLVDTDTLIPDPYHWGLCHTSLRSYTAYSRCTELQNKIWYGIPTASQQICKRNLHQFPNNPSEKLAVSLCSALWSDMCLRLAIGRVNVNFKLKVGWMMKLKQRGCWFNRK